jgi:hypothetical protein
MGWRAAVLGLCLLPVAGHCDVLTFGIWPTSNPADSISCRIELKSGQINVVEVHGTGMPPRHPMRWPVRRAEEAAVLSTLLALVSGDLPGVDPYTSRPPNAPYVTVTWSTEVDGVRVNGLYVQTGLDLPATMARLVDTVIPGSGCQSAAG